MADIYSVSVSSVLCKSNLILCTRKIPPAPWGHDLANETGHMARVVTLSLGWHAMEGQVIPVVSTRQCDVTSAFPPLIISFSASSCYLCSDVCFPVVIHHLSPVTRASAPGKYNYRFSSICACSLLALASRKRLKTWGQTQKFWTPWQCVTLWPPVQFLWMILSIKRPL